MQEKMYGIERLAKILADMPKDQAERIVELANAYLDGITAGMRLIKPEREERA